MGKRQIVFIKVSLMAKISLGNAIRVANSWGFPKGEPGLIQELTELHLQSQVGGSLTCCSVCIHPTACLKPAQSWSHAGYCSLCNLHFFLWSYLHFPSPELREITMDIFSVVSEETPTPMLLGSESSIKDKYLTGSWAHIVYNTDTTNSLL